MRVSGSGRHRLLNSQLACSSSSRTAYKLYFVRVVITRCDWSCDRAQTDVVLEVASRNQAAYLLKEV